MSKESLVFSGIAETADRIADGEISPVEVVEAVLQRIERLNPKLNAYITVIEESLQEARVMEQLMAQGKAAGSLLGVPLSVKDLVLTRGTPTTAGSKIYGEGIASGGDALLVRRLRQAGAILVGKTNLHECAFGVTNENEHFGPARNPWDLERVTGGSSGGSGAAVASGLCHGSIGSDTRGSIRIPSTCCGITGLKPTLNLVPMKGVVPLSHSLDHVGPMARSVEDVARMLGPLVGGSKDYTQALRLPVDSLRLGVCEYYFRNLDAEIQGAVNEAVRVFKDAGVEVREVEIGCLDEALEASDIITRAEAVAYHDSHLRERPELMGTAVRQRIEAGYAVTGMEYVRSGQTQARVREQFRKVFGQVDCLIGAALPAFPPPLGENHVLIDQDEESVVHAFVRTNAPQNMAGIPALVFPCGFSKAGLPVGLQLIAGRHREDILFRLGAHFQGASDWHLRRPPLEA